MALRRCSVTGPPYATTSTKTSRTRPGRAAGFKSTSTTSGKSDQRCVRRGARQNPRLLRILWQHQSTGVGDLEAVHLDVDD